jgi:hypothetical protein
MLDGIPGVKLSYMATNSLVAEFKKLVIWAYENKHQASADIVDDGSKIATLDEKLYNIASNLSEAQSCEFQYTDTSTNENTYKFGKFSGGQHYILGTIDGKKQYVIVKENNSPHLLKASEGWVTLINGWPNYVQFNNGENTYIIELSSFEPKHIIYDFEPLYKKLKDSKDKNNVTIADDTKATTSQATTNKEASSNTINNESDESDSNYESSVKNNSNNDDTNMTVLESSAHFFGIYPAQIGPNKFNAKNDSVYNNIQAVLYDLPSYEDNKPTDIKNSSRQLFCFQQPESISYTAAAQYDAENPRGTQQPFQFYVQSNAIELTFTLKWHIDEVRSLVKTANSSYNFDDITTIAEDFTRPWSVNGSLTPKICKVILPGISHIGYITQAGITYNGDMAGNLLTGSGILSGNDDNLIQRNVYDYFYSQLEISFTMLIIKDIVLRPIPDSSQLGLGVTLVAEGEQIKEPKNKIVDNTKNSSKESKDTKEVSGEVEANNNANLTPEAVNTIKEYTAPVVKFINNGLTTAAYAFARGIKTAENTQPSGSVSGNAH